MNKEDKICVFGSNGLLGHAVVNELTKKGYTNIIKVDRSIIDLRDQKSTKEYFEAEKPAGVFFLAAVAAGISFKQTHPVEMLLNNLQMVTNVISFAHEYGVKKLINICSALIYPSCTSMPLNEEDAVSVDLTSIDTPYALAKSAGVMLSKYYRREYGDQFISAVPCNFFGEYAPFDDDRAGVVPALIAKIYKAKKEKIPQVEVWGTGNACRDFLNSKDVASACVFLFENHVDYDFINIGSGKEVTIREAAETIRRVVGYEGDLYFNATKPEGRLHMQLNVERLFSMGWCPKMNLEESIREAYEWYQKNS